MKKFFEKIWAAIRKPLHYAAVALIALAFGFSVVDSIIRCFHAQILNGVLQFLVCLVAAPVLYLLCRALIIDAPKSE
jgi:hypothetical protein